MTTDTAMVGNPAASAISTSAFFRSRHHKNALSLPATTTLLEDAELLLEYACESGIPVDHHMADIIVSAGSRERSDAAQTVEVLEAITCLATHLKPVTAESIRASKHAKAARRYLHHLWWMTGLGIFLLLFSMIGYITGNLSDTIEADITASNKLILVITSAADVPNADQTQVSYDLKSNAQLLVSTIRDINRLSSQLDGFLCFCDNSAKIRDKPVQASDLEIDARPFKITEVAAKLPIFQAVRAFAQDTERTVALVYGAATKFVLPPLYGVLGVLVSLLRSFSEQVRLRTFVPSTTNSAHFIVAAIGGGIVGLFNSSFISGAWSSLSPLAIAFLIGYSTDVFFFALDGLKRNFTEPNKPTVTINQGAA